MSVSDIIGLINALGIFLAGLAALRNGRRINTVQDTVNGKASESHARIDQLVQTLADAGIIVPGDKRSDTVTPETGNDKAVKE